MNMSTHSITGSLLLLPIWLTSAAQQADFEKLAGEAMRAGHLAKIKDICDRWAAAEPKSPGPHVLLGRAYARAKMPDKAIEQFVMASEKGAKAEARTRLGQVYAASRQWSASMREFEAALEADPERIDARLGKARVHMEFAKWAEAAQEAAAVLKLAPTHLPAQRILVETEIERLRPDQAIKRASQTLDAMPENPTAQALAGLALLAGDEHEDAREAFDCALASDPRHADALYGKAVLCERLSDKDRAVDHWRRFLEVEPEGDRATRVRRGWVPIWHRPFSKKHDLWLWSYDASPDGRGLYAAFKSGDFWYKPFANDGEPKLLGAQGEAMCRPACSPDGRAVVYRVGVGPHVYDVKVFDLLSGQIRFLPGPRRKGYDQRFPSSEPVVIYRANADREHYEVDLRTEEERRVPLVELLPEEVRWARGPSSFNASSLVFSALIGRRHELARMDRDGSGFMLLTQLNDSVSWNAWSPSGRDALFSLVRDEGPREKRRTVRHVGICATDGSKDATVLIRRPGWNNFTWLRDGRGFIVGTGKPYEVVLGGLPRDRLGLSVEPQALVVAPQTVVSVSVKNVSPRPLDLDLEFETFGPNGVRLHRGVAEEDVAIAAGSSAVIPVPTDDLPVGENVLKLTAALTPEDRQINFFTLDVKK